MTLAVSLGAHLALAAGLATVPPRRTHEATAITVVETRKPAKAPEPPRPPDPPPAEEAPRPARAKATPAAPKAAPPLPGAPAPAPAPDAFPDFGLSLSGQGGGGLAVPVAHPGPAPSAPPTARTLSRVATRTDDCNEPQPKPHPVSNPTPVYPPDALAARVSGFVRVAITVAPDGHVSTAEVLQGLGHGCDEAAMAAARAARFEPVSRCGKPSSATVRVRYTFAPPAP